MSDANEHSGPESPVAQELEASTEESVRAMLRGALGEPEAMPDLMQGVQQKLRLRSGGKFYGDGWSTARHPPVNTYLITSLLMLFVLGVIYALIAPLSGAPERGKPAEPVHIMSR